MDPTAQPLLVEMITGSAGFGNLTGIVIRQQKQGLESVAQALGVPYEMANKYKVAALPADKACGKSQDDVNMWKPGNGDLIALPPLMMAFEDTSFCNRCVLACCGCGNLRPYHMHFFEGAQPRKGGELFTNDRPFTCGGMCCCPQEITTMQNGKPIGRIYENFEPYGGKCWEACCCCTYYTDVQRPDNSGGYITDYTVRLNLCCCGEHDNCCGATCCKNDIIVDIIDSKGEVAGQMQKTYAPGDGEDTWDGACLRCCCMFSNWMVEFPKDANEIQRALLMGSVFQMDYIHFEKQGNDN